MLLRFGKDQPRLTNHATVSALQPWNGHDQLDLTRPHRRQLETPFLLPESNHLPGLTSGALEFAGMDMPVKNRLAALKTAR